MGYSESRHKALTILIPGENYFAASTKRFVYIGLVSKNQVVVVTKSLVMASKFSCHRSRDIDGGAEMKELQRSRAVAALVPISVVQISQVNCRQMSIVI